MWSTFSFYIDGDGDVPIGTRLNLIARHKVYYFGQITVFTCAKSVARFYFSKPFFQILFFLDTNQFNRIILFAFKIFILFTMMCFLVGNFFLIFLFFDRSSFMVFWLEGDQTFCCGIVFFSLFSFLI